MKYINEAYTDFENGKFVSMTDENEDNQKCLYPILYPKSKNQHIQNDEKIISKSDVSNTI